MWDAIIKIAERVTARLFKASNLPRMPNYEKIFDMNREAAFEIILGEIESSSSEAKHPLSAEIRLLLALQFANMLKLQDVESRLQGLEHQTEITQLRQTVEELRVQLRACSSGK